MPTILLDARVFNYGESKLKYILDLIVCGVTYCSVMGNSEQLPPAGVSEEEDERILANEPWVQTPIHIDYGTNMKVGPGVFINFNFTALDTCLITIGARTLIGPNVSIFSGTHPIDPYLRNGTNGPELGKEVVIGEDVWIAGNVTILPGVTIGNGSTIGAGSVVTKDVPALWVAAGNPARLLKRVDQSKEPGAEDHYPSSMSRQAAAPAADAKPPTSMDDYCDDDQGW